MGAAASTASTANADAARRSVVPKQVQDAGHGSPWLAAVWTGLGAAIVCATVAIVVVAACWLPVSGSGGRTNSAIRAGLLSFLAAVHGGITVDGVHATWLPLGMLLAVALTCRRAGHGLADAVDTLGERDPVRLALAAGTQIASFTVGCLVAVPFATLGTSRAPFLGVALGAIVVFAVSGGAAFVRATPLREWCADRLPASAPAIARAAATVVACYLLAGAALTAASLVSHHAAAERLSAATGGGLGGIPVLLLGVLAAPNAAVSAASYLAGPGFSVGADTHASLFGHAHGVLPAFPLLAAVPSGAANPAAWVLAAALPLLAGGLVARIAMRADGWRARLGHAAGAALGAGVLMFLLAWQAGGSAGDGRLQTVGASPWQLGAAVTAVVGIVALAGVGLAIGWQAINAADDDDVESIVSALRFPRLLAVHRDDEDEDHDEDDDATDDEDRADHLAG